ncbi:cysteine hydrolase family protein [Flaviflagellibacter deserti]|uniref:Cysteine hydrolase family protein n=1 Tax=Flaviflagellibacter deserti TaxID=2267266 RepID=A0ABV9Z2T6_9HYPH
MADRLKRPLGARMVHLCVDMQRIFSSRGIWPTPWMERVLPTVVRIAERHPERTVFTRFITPRDADDLPGTWQLYYRKWHQATRAELPADLLDLMPELAKFVPPATVLDKSFYSAFAGTGLDAWLRERQVDGLVVTGSETDVCVLSTVLSAVDLGWRVIVVADALASASDEGHDNLLDLYNRRYAEQVETVDSEALLDLW